MGIFCHEPEEQIFNPKIQFLMERKHAFQAKDSTLLTLITAILYFIAILSFAYLFTMS